MSLLLSCDGGGDKTPGPLVAAMQGEGIELPQHTDWTIDRPAMWATRLIAAGSGQPAVINPFRGDLVDVRRTPAGRGWLAPPLREAVQRCDDPAAMAELIKETIDTPYRGRLQRAIAQAIATSGEVTHLSIRSHEGRRSRGRWVRGDVGIGYDTARPREAEAALDLMDALADDAAHLKVRRNHPVRGNVAGMTRWLRRQYPGDQYVGLEVSLNRAWVGRQVARRETTLVAIGHAIAAIAELPVAMVA